MLFCIVWLLLSKEYYYGDHDDVSCGLLCHDRRRNDLYRRRCQSSSGCLRGRVPVYGWLAGVSAIRDYRKAHPTNWTSTGIDAWNKYMDKSLPNTIYGAGCAFWTASSCFTGVGLLVNALIILS